MVLLSLNGLTPAQIAALLDQDPATVGRWIGRFHREGAAARQARDTVPTSAERVAG